MSGQFLGLYRDLCHFNANKLNPCSRVEKAKRVCTLPWRMRRIRDIQTLGWLYPYPNFPAQTMPVSHLIENSLGPRGLCGQDSINIEETMCQGVKGKLIASVKSPPNAAAGRWKFAVHIYDSIKSMSTSQRGAFSPCHLPIWGLCMDLIGTVSKEPDGDGEFGWINN